MPEVVVPIKYCLVDISYVEDIISDELKIDSKLLKWCAINKVKLISARGYDKKADIDTDIDDIVKSMGCSKFDYGLLFKVNSMLDCNKILTDKCLSGFSLIPVIIVDIGFYSSREDKVPELFYVNLEVERLA